MAQEKTFGTTSVLTFLGLEINTMHTNVKIPYGKSSQFKSVWAKIHDDKQKGNIEAIAESYRVFNFSVLASGRAFVRRLYNNTRGLTKPRHRRRVTTEMKKKTLILGSNFQIFSSYQLVNWTTEFSSAFVD